MVRTGIGFDSHRLIEGRRLVLGGVTIPHSKGLLGHSDADALTHAIADALLGAACEGDIGKHFPDTDPQWKDADSLKLLSLIVELLRDKGYIVVNVDATVIAQAPELASHLDAMRTALAQALSVEAHAVSVKATTAEKMGAFGREEGIGVMAVATIEK